MNLPRYPLGVAVMDEDHYTLEQMFAGASKIDDAALPAHFEAIVAEIRAHFAREEAAMAKAGVPILHCHKGQHALLLGEAEKLRENFARADAPMRRHLIGFTLAQLVANHVAGIDQVSSTFFDHKADLAAASDRGAP